jgi:poly(3-hydroxybutyrate) depolymerase
MMHHLLPAMLIAASAFSATRTDLKVGTRTAIVYTPTGHKNSPLVISMHGMGFGAGWMQGMVKFETYADTSKEKFITVYPQGENNGWDLGSMKDVNFITAIIDSMYNRYKIDRNRVYASGFSMGGMMCWYLSCKIPDKIAAIVPGNGFPLGGMSGCSETRHVPVLHMHGNADDFVKYTDFSKTFLPAQLTRYGCPTKVTTKPYPVNKPTSGSYKDYYGPCVKNGLKSEITFITVDGMIHDWATLGKANENPDTKYKGKMFDIDGTHEAWNWMKTQSLTGSVGIEDPSVHASKQPVIRATYSEGGVHLESSQEIRSVRVTNLQGKSVAAWESNGKSTSSLSIQVTHAGRGILLVDALGPDGHAVSRLAIP